MFFRCGAQKWPPHSPRPRATVYFFKLFSCGGPEMAPALPPAADNRSAYTPTP